MSTKAEEDPDIIVENDDDCKAPPAKKPFLTSTEIRELSRDEIIHRFANIEKYVTNLEGKCANTEQGTNPEIEEKLKLQQQESTRRENVLVMRLATKEQEMQELLTQIHELKQSQNPTTSQLKSTLLDPSVNLLFEKMKTELGDVKEKLEQAQNDLSAWKFTSDSVTGKKLMAKCRMLIAENQDLGKQLSQGRIAQLEAELALQKKYNDELKCSQDELNDFVLQLDEEVEGMESTICALQQQLKETKQKYQNSQEEISTLKARFENVNSVMPCNEGQTTDLSRNDFLSKNSKFQTVDIRNNIALREQAKDYNEDEEENYDHSKRTKQSYHSAKTEENMTFATTKDSFSISKLLSPEKTESKFPWTVTNDVPDVGSDKNEKYHEKPGTNGGFVDSDSNMSS